MKTEFSSPFNYLGDTTVIAEKYTAIVNGNGIDTDTVYFTVSQLTTGSMFIGWSLGVLTVLFVYLIYDIRRYMKGKKQ